MSITVLDQKPALIVIDLQEGLRGLPMSPSSVEEVTGRAAELAAAFRRRRFTVVLVNTPGFAPGRTEQRPSAASDPWPQPEYSVLVPELNAQPEDVLITKTRWGAFHDTNLHNTLQELGVTQVLIAGIATSLAVESTARSAHEHGYNVVLAVDAMTDPDGAAHTNSVERIFTRLGETGTTEQILDLI